MFRLLTFGAGLSLLIAVGIGVVWIRSLSHIDSYSLPRDDGSLYQFASGNGGFCYAVCNASGYGTEEQLNQDVASEFVASPASVAWTSIPFFEHAWTDAYGAGALRGHAQVF